MNFFQPQQKLVEKTPEGAKVHQRYDAARTPYQRVLTSPDVTPEAKEALTATYEGLNPVELKRRIGSCQDRLLEMARTKSLTRKEVTPPPTHPFRRAFSPKQIRGHPW